MGIEYDVELAVGYWISFDELLLTFGQQIERVTHLEDRFDPKTGHKVAPEVVVDQEEQTVFIYDGHSFELGEVEELMETICNDLECGFWVDGSYLKKEKSLSFVVGPRQLGRRAVRNSPTPDLSAYGEIDFEELLQAKDRLEEIRRGLKELGLAPGEAVVTQAVLIS